jgi:signal transduction histidine kinase
MVLRQIESHLTGKEVASKSIAFTHATKDGRMIPCETSGEVIDYNGRPAILTSMRDVSGRIKAEQDKDRLQAQLQQAQKMEAIGTLAGGIAHDFNNLLGVIVGNNELAMDEIPEWSPARENLEEIYNACMKARDLVKQILAFSRQMSQRMESVEIGPLIKESLKLLRSSFPTTIEIRQNISCQSDTVNADPTQIYQVLLNLCTNASHAMEDVGGLLEVRLENIVLDEADAAQYADMYAGKYVRLTVADTGHGIEADVIDRIFEPYFTTKELGKGTGMGLAVAHGIVKNHGGHISVYSTPGEGTTFHVYLPVMRRRSNLILKHR